MPINLSRKEIKSILKEERKRATNPYKDKADVMIDSVARLHEEKKIDKHMLNTLLSLVLINITQDAINDSTKHLVHDLTTKNFMNIPNVEQNKVLLLNYSKQSYA